MVVSLPHGEFRHASGRHHVPPLGSRQRLAAAAGGEFTDAELSLLYGRGSDRPTQEVWSEADLPMLDELDHLFNDAAPATRCRLTDPIGSEP